MEDQKITREVAEKEVSAWLDFKKFTPARRESKAMQIETLINAVMDGNVTISEGNELVQKLQFPIGKDGLHKELTFKPRLNIGAVQHHLQKVAADDADGRVNGYIQALTGKPSAIIKELDTDDYGISQAIALFFI